MIKKMLYKVFGSRNDRLLKSYAKIVKKINDLEEVVQKLSDDQFKQKTAEFKQRYIKGESLDSLLPEVFAVCREAGKRALNMRHFDVQLIGGIVLHSGKIAEMRTGEGKTLVATLAVYLNAITGKGVHLVTVNDYLANRDAKEMGKLYNFLGLSVGINLPNMSHLDKQAAYACDITYGTNNEFGFDYLRDNMVFEAKDKVQRTLEFAVVDEVDSILIDEARTPLIISGPADGTEELYVSLNQVPKMLTRQELEESDGDFWVDEKNNNVILSEEGHIKVEKILADLKLINAGDSLYAVHNISLMHHLLAALKAHYVYLKDQHYVVQDGEVVIVDEFTGRLMSGRRWSDGLHQAVEAKEGVEIQRENQTMASITFQNYFRMYHKLSGMTGTADTEAYEFQQIYNLETVVIPTNKTMIRRDHNDKIYMNLNDKYKAIIEEIASRNKDGQPVLVGTTSVENSEIISKLLTKAGLKHEVLNAKQHSREADIIVQAGSPKAITVATNMAGRGTDIILGGNPKPELAIINDNPKLSEAEKEQQSKIILNKWKEKNAEVLASGGLCIIGTERHESRRIDNQLRGRSGRQGDPGSSLFFLCLDDPLLRIFGGERMRGMMQRLGMDEGESIEHKWLSRSIESAQRKVEGHNFDIRKQLLEYDNVANDQRRVIYQQRDEILNSHDLSDITHGMITAVVGQVFDENIPPQSTDDMWNVKGLEHIIKNEFLLDYDLSSKLVPNSDERVIRKEVIELAVAHYNNKMLDFAKHVTEDISKFVNSILVADKAQWNIAALDGFCAQNGIILDKSMGEVVNSAPDITREEVIHHFMQKIGEVGNLQVLRFERGVLLQHIDHHWRDHLTQLEQLRQGIHLRGYAQKDPKQEYKQESFSLFSLMLENVKRDAAKVLLTVKIQGMQDVSADEFQEVDNSQQNLTHNKPNSVFTNNVTQNTNQTVSRNAPCPCGSGKKYKHCCGKLA